MSLVRVGDAPAIAIPIELKDHLILPGLVNAHDHLQLNSVPPLPHAKPFANSYEWIDAFDAHRRDPTVVTAVGVPESARCWQGGLKNLVSGATTVAHHDPWNAAFDDPRFPVGVVREYGWSHSLSLGQPRGERAPRYGPPVRASFDATPPGKPWIIHLAEGTDTVAGAELRQLDALGCLAANTVLVHGVGLSSSDIDLVVERSAAVVWCPSSNIGMFGRTLDAGAIRRLFDAGHLALGTDSRLTGSRDLLEELRVAEAHSDLTPDELLNLVTTCGMSILRIAQHDEAGDSEDGDCVIVRAGPAGDPGATLLQTSRGDIRAVVRGGEPVVADPDFAPWFEHCGIATAEILLDGRQKLIAARTWRHASLAAAL